jgi:hypothetical protein
MTNSDTHLRATIALEAILSLLADVTISERIDLPIDRAVESFRLCWDQSFAPAEFHRLLGEFIMHVHSFLGKAELVHGSRAEDEAISFLVQHYQGLYEVGYDGAVLDAMAELGEIGHGIDLVLLGLAEIIKGLKRQEYCDWVYARYLDPFDRELLCSMVSVIEERYPEFLVEMHGSGPDELIHEMRYLLDNLREVQSCCTDLRSEGPEFVVAGTCQGTDGDVAMAPRHREPSSSPFVILR